MKYTRVSVLLTVLVAILMAGCVCAPAATPPPTDVPPAPTEPTSVPTEPPPTPTEPPPTPTEEPELPAIFDRLHWLGWASFRLDGPPVIYFDPAEDIGSEQPPADIILISHPHYDHFSIPDITLISGPETVIVANPQVAGTFEMLEVAYAEVRAMQPGERTTVGSVEIETVPAYNIDTDNHPKDAGHLGFIVTLEGERLYFAGDTDHIPEMADIECDVALLPIMGGGTTMSPEEAAQAAVEIGARVTVPMHGTSYEAFRDLCDCFVVVMEEE